MSCEPCPGVEEVVADLEAMGIAVLDARLGSDGLIHRMACFVRSSGLGYLVLVSPEDAEALAALGRSDPPSGR